MGKVRTALSTAVGSVAHDAQLSVVDHLDELRTRLFVCVAVVVVAFGFCFWQNHHLLNFINTPLAKETQKATKAGQGPLGSTYTVQRSARDLAVQTDKLATAVQTLHNPAINQALDGVSSHVKADVKALSAPPQGNKPVTLGIGEPFNSTVSVSFIFALILSLPILLYQIYAFFTPALEPDQRKRMRPVLVAVPTLFIAGVAFGYEVVLPAAVHFLQNFNADEYNVLVQAGPYYHFAAMILLVMGLVFEVPVMIIALSQTGTISPTQFRRGRRIAIAACASVAAFLPGDVVTMLFETIPLYLLFELGVLIADVLDRRSRSRAVASAALESTA